MKKEKIPRFLFYVFALYTTIVLILIVVSDLPIREMKGLPWALISGICLTIAMAFEWAKRKNKSD